MKNKINQTKIVKRQSREMFKGILPRGKIMEKKKKDISQEEITNGINEYKEN